MFSLEGIDCLGLFTLHWCIDNLGNLNNKHLFPANPKAEKSQIKVQADLVSSEGLLPDS